MFVVKSIFCYVICEFVAYKCRVGMMRIRCIRLLHVEDTIDGEYTIAKRYGSYITKYVTFFSSPRHGNVRVGVSQYIRLAQSLSRRRQIVNVIMLII